MLDGGEWLVEENGWCRIRLVEQNGWRQCCDSTTASYCRHGKSAMKESTDTVKLEDGAGEGSLGTVLRGLED
jgi:hypothetical protein